MGKIQTLCEHCSTKLSVPESASGKKIRCPKCKGIVLISAPEGNHFDHGKSNVDEGKQSEWSVEDPWGNFTPNSATAVDLGELDSSFEQLPRPEKPRPLPKEKKTIAPLSEARAASEEKWFYEEKGKRKGPVSESEMIQLINSAAISRGTSVWKQGFPDWLKVENTDLQIHLDNSVPPPLSGEHINNTIVWVLAFAPLIGQFLEGIVAGAIHGDFELATQAVADNDYWFVTLGLNIALSFFDERRVKSAGHNTDKFNGWVWLVPVYLYQRAKATRQNLAYFIVWMVCFVLAIL